MSGRAFAFAVVAAVGATCIPARAADDGNIASRLESLEQKIQAQQREIEAERAEIEALRQQLAQRKALVEPAAPAPTPVVVMHTMTAPPKPEIKSSFSRGRVTLETADGDYSLSVRGRVQLDAGDYFQTAAGPLSTDWRRGSVDDDHENISATDLSNATNFRRAQIGVEGRFVRDFFYRIIYEMGGSGSEDNPRVNEGSLRYKRYRPWTIQLGALAPSANLDDATSSADTMFLERATPAELSRSLGAGDGRIAVGVEGNGSRWFAAANLTGSIFTAAEVFDEEEALVARLAARPFAGENYNLHVGLNGTWEFKPADIGGGATPNTSLEFRDRPELRVDGTRLIDTGPIEANAAYTAGLELAGSWKGFTAQAEAFVYDIDRPQDIDTAAFSGWYAQASYVLTGEQRPYNAATASFASPLPARPLIGSGGIGAVEIAARYSHSDLDHHPGIAEAAPPLDGIRGGVQNIWTLGINWYPIDNVKLMLDYQFVDVRRLNPASPADPAPFGAGDATPPIGVQIGQSLQMISFRSQFSF